MRRVDVKPERRVSPEQRHGAFGQLAGVLAHVLRGDLQHWLLRGERVRVLAVAGAGKRRRIRAGPSWDRALLVARLLGPERGQRGLQLRRFVGRNGGPCDVRRERGDGDGRGHLLVLRHAGLLEWWCWLGFRTWSAR
ncbi:hypothetical protein D3C72_1907850 [compost metagenome]